MEFLDGPAPEVARRLLGCELERILPSGEVLRVRLTETEAYDQSDPASHSFRGATERTRAMFGPPGQAYVYLSYGIHYCLNIVCGPEGHGAGVLIRSVEPLDGLAAIRRLRGNRPDGELTNGPGKVGQALLIDSALYGHDPRLPPLRLIVRPAVAESRINATPRIGIRKAATVPWRFVLSGSASGGLFK